MKLEQWLYLGGRGARERERDREREREDSPGKGTRVISKETEWYMTLPKFTELHTTIYAFYCV